DWNRSRKETDDDDVHREDRRRPRRQASMAAVQGARQSASHDLPHDGPGAGAVPGVLRGNHEGGRPDGRPDVDAWRSRRPVRAGRGGQNPDPRGRRRGSGGIRRDLLPELLGRSVDQPGAGPVGQRHRARVLQRDRARVQQRAGPTGQGCRARRSTRWGDPLMTAPPTAGPAIRVQGQTRTIARWGMAMGEPLGESLHTVTTLPTARRPGCPFDPPAELIDARQHGPISRYPLPDGHQGWLIPGYDLVRSVLADSRFSSRRELMRHHPTIDITGMEVPPAPPGEFLLMDDPQHGRYRKPLVGKFTVRRMRLLTERVEQITVDHLDAMQQAGPPADLVTAFAKPIPAIMICELLGVPYQDRGSFQEQIESFLSGETSDEDQLAAY